MSMFWSADDGFDAGEAHLPAPHPAIDPQRREAAALMLTAIAMHATPEDLAHGVTAEVLQLWADPLEREEALAHVDLLSAVLAPWAATA